MADSFGEIMVEKSSSVVSSDEDEINGVKKLLRKTPSSRSAKKSHLSRPPLASVGNRELCDLSKFSKGSIKMNLGKEKSRAKKKTKKDINRADLSSSHVDHEGEKDFISDFTSEGEAFEKDNICYDAKPLQVVEAGAMMEKSIFLSVKESGKSKESSMAEAGLERCAGGKELFKDASDLNRSRSDLIPNFSLKNLDVSDEGRKEKEEDRRLSEMEFNRFMHENIELGDVSGCSIDSGHLKAEILSVEWPESGKSSRNILQNSIRGDRHFEVSDFVIDREIGLPGSFGVVNPSKFIESLQPDVNLERSKLDGNLNRDPLDSGNSHVLPFLNQAAQPYSVPENPNFQNPSSHNQLTEPPIPCLPSVQSPPIHHISSNPTVRLQEDSCTINQVPVQQLTHSATFPNLNQSQLNRVPDLGSSLHPPISTRPPSDIVVGSVMNSQVTQNISPNGQNVSNMVKAPTSAHVNRSTGNKEIESSATSDRIFENREVMGSASSSEDRHIAAVSTSDSMGNMLMFTAGQDD
ncbi:hypothetical protein C2S52_007429 [Perilla frutescens var. hirtella]|nr:hypothetical protein C2S52_007429 [Perilla frutescens var. hirtella]